MLFVSLQDFLCQIERCCKQYHLITPITFPTEHPVEEVGRLLLCCLLKHQDLGNHTIDSFVFSVFMFLNYCCLNKLVLLQTVFFSFV